MIENLKILIDFIINYFINLLVSPSKEIKQKSLLLIRLDAIGDYVLFRNYIEILKKSKKYRDYSLTLLGNSAWKSITKELDSEYIDNFIWLDRNKFNKGFVYRFIILKKLISVGYEVVISPAFSREFFYADTIVNLINAKEKIGSAGDLSNIKRWQKNISDKYYDRLIATDTNLMFEFDRNREFFENLLEQKLDIKKPHMSLKPTTLAFDLPQNYAILFIGASTCFRKWSTEGFAKVGKYLQEKFGYKIVLCGAPSDSKEAKEFAKYFKSEYTDLVGKTSLIDLLHVINSGNLIVTNETSSPHFAIALEMANIFVIYSGNHYGRFTPYPKEIAQNYHVILHPKIEKDLDNYKKLSNSYGYWSNLDISEIHSEIVIENINRVLNG
ncbi:MAG: hypothetical protein COB67_07240 [SAR324 cluster bacterium]|uniref:Lipopolysaccharide heptosyltransferase family protein n=1 Tax=SAR324 cluster bacterium TaxID=2024889 RepID=A0A2A4T324_9DELT|nr:MAG: hypothetical protein COB67_07240 [SAR324 cluster bacterium]